MFKLKSAVETALEKLEAREPIPLMTHPLSKYWDQPNRREIEIDEIHALMTRNTFNKLHEYSGTIPTGAYEGKMWKRHDGLCDREFMSAGGKPVWLLMWYGPYPPDPNEVSINHRIILLVD